MDATPLVTGPLVLWHESLATLGPVTVHVGAPVGAREPETPVIVAV